VWWHKKGKYVLRYLVLTLCLLSQPCFPSDWQSQAARSKLAYSVNFEQQPISGRFEHFLVVYRIATDTTPLQLTVTVDVASANMGNSDINETIRESDWFDASHYPQAKFTSSVIEKDPDGNFIANGTLRLKGVKQPVNLPFTWNPVVGQPGAMLMTGQVVLNRLDFLIGTGDWASDDEIGLSVTVDFTVTFIADSIEIEP
jgi:polyisoprenoid-binding protein YceI